MPEVDVYVGSARFKSFEVPEACTVSGLKQIFSKEHNVLYTAKLRCHASKSGDPEGKELHDSAELPWPPMAVLIGGPGSVVQMVELVLKKKAELVGPPLPKAPPSPVHRPSLLSPPSQPLSQAQHSLPSGPPKGRMELDLQYKGKTKALDFLAGSIQGMRDYQEDRTVAVTEFSQVPHLSLFAVFDGHGGASVSTYLQENMAGAVARCAEKGGDLSEAMASAFAELDGDLASRRNQFFTVGSTAVVALVTHAARTTGSMKVIVANTGDSRAVLCSSGGKAKDLSEDHKPQDALEKARIEAAGGRVAAWGPCWRIDGGLNLSRAFGDFSYKGRFDLSDDQQKVISIPDVKTFDIGPEDKFMVLGSDGVFDAMSSQALIEFLWERHNRGEVWDEVIEACLKACTNSGDNVSLVIVEFLH